MASCFTQEFYIFGRINKLKELFLSLSFRDIMYFSRTFALPLQCKETVLTISSLLCESSVNYAPKCESLASFTIKELLF